MRLLKTFLLLVFLAFCLPVYSQTDTVASRYVGPGVKHLSITFPSIPWKINVLEVDITNPFITLETVKASKNGREQLRAFEKTSSMANRKSYSGHVVVGAVNGDFYNTQTGEPINMQIENGEILKKPYPRSVFGIAVDKKPFIEIFSFFGSLIVGDSLIAINGINEARGSDMLIFYNGYFGDSTATNQWGSEALISPLNQWIVNDTLYCIVDTIVNWVGSMKIPVGKAVLSGHGRAGEFLRNNLKIKDTVKIVLRLTPNVGKVFQAIGGLPRIIRDGQNVVAQTYQQEGASSSFTYSRHPRTAVGFSKDSTKIYFITVDGRQASSVGMTLDELANFMLTLGVWNGVNLDGGGSTTMVVRGKVVNSPSDATGERSVSNAIIIVSSAPQDTLSRIEIEPKRLKIFRGEQFQFSVFGYDKYFNPVQITSDQISWSCDSSIGTISLSGLFTAGRKNDSGYVYVTHINGLRDSCFVVVYGMKNISISPKNVVTDTSRTIQFSVKGFDLEGNFRTISASDVEWKVIGDIGTVNVLGLFRGQMEGSGKVVSKFDELSDTADVQVVIGKGERLLEKFDEMKFTVSTENIDECKIFLSDTNFISESKSLGIEYRFIHVSGKQHWIYVNSEIPIYGVPDSIYLYAYGDGGSYRVYYFVADDNDEIFVFTGGLINWANEWRRIGASTKYPIQTASGTYFCYPIKILKIAFYFTGAYSDGLEYSGKIFIDDLSVTYPVKVTLVEDEPIAEKLRFKLFQNYPNPFNSETKIKFSIPESVSHPVELKIYDVLGRETARIFEGELKPGIYEVNFDSSGLSSGVYFCVLLAGKFRDVIKMVVLK
ncbi:Por secretion system C-terminal sorting domain-containing protein [Candidatus Kryptonium thompsonii]|uniref:phosphodiester glycosidase family protein n=1 Tax=Candidatus Kryptonium thompsonii TaxID=1633631 RepID=UPI0007077737|nr:phosphodiester glycosidase family protein [Candidatus Kryptonium thompsoni]CUS88033.1 Por secretion system C-terminal sorting domain-containing protein [Candidatus Kryptonium thompsoni]CUT08128.1 Por secretion system C-terminal sorting domain-containing protein [Candidatus Kryptonium thompsoni]